MERLKGIDDLKSLRSRLGQTEDGNRVTIQACGGSACRAGGSKKVIKEIRY
jgi:NADH:ubiquinone oxidoreductase subunit E